MMSCHRTRAAALAAIFGLIVVSPKLLAATFVPVSGRVTAHAQSGTVIDQPPDVIVGPVYGEFTNEAEAINPQGPVISRGSARLNITESVLSQSVSGHSGGNFMGIVGTGGGSVLSVVDIPEQTTFDVYLAKFGSPTHFGATATIRVAGGPTIFSQGAPFTTLPPPIVLTLGPGRYEVGFTGFAAPTAGSSGGGSGSFRLTPIPEPASALTVLGVLVMTLRRRHRTE
jgi:hypothetical protein